MKRQPKGQSNGGQFAPSKNPESTMVFSELSTRTVDEDGTVTYRDWEGQFHRDDGPAVEYLDGTKKWYINGLRHRKDGPAIEWACVLKMWCIHDELHREDGPAVEWLGGSKEWYIHNQLHREDGPAIEKSDGSKKWYIHGQELTEEEFLRRSDSAH
jgi:hypothetical protein